LHERLERYTEAEEAYRKAADLDPKHACLKMQLVKLVLAGLKQPDRALELAQQFLAATPDNASLLNGMAWVLFESGQPTYLSYAEEWARKAVALEADPSHLHTLACVLSRAGKAAEALQFTRRLLDDPKFVGGKIDDMVMLFAEMVAADCAAEAFATLRDSNSATTLEPLALALQMHIGIDVHVAREIVEVAKDVLQRFQSRLK
jgi:tetratricopeptide (TPR) repeat protein